MIFLKIKHIYYIIILLSIISCDKNKNKLIIEAEAGSQKAPNVEFYKTPNYYFELNIPDTIKNGKIFGEIKYHYYLSDTIKTSSRDYRLLTLSAELIKKQKTEPGKLVEKQLDTFYSQSENFIDTLKCPIFFKVNKNKGIYSLRGDIIIRSFPRYYDEKESVKVVIREFYFTKELFVQ